MRLTHFIAVEHELAAFHRAKCFLRLIKGIPTGKPHVERSEAQGLRRMWSATRNALLIHVSTGHTLGSTDRLLKAAGMKIMGGGYVG